MELNLIGFVVYYKQFTPAGQYQKPKLFLNFSWHNFAKNFAKLCVECTSSSSQTSAKNLRETLRSYTKHYPEFRGVLGLLVRR